LRCGFKLLALLATRALLYVPIFSNVRNTKTDTSVREENSHIQHWHLKQLTKTHTHTYVHTYIRTYTTTVGLSKFLAQNNIYFFLLPKDDK
jgi:hypothetical protein